MKKFSDAFSGLKFILKHKAFLIQLVLAVMAVAGGLIIKLDYYEWLAFIVCISVVLALETINTAIEKICDYMNLQYDEKIKEIKDMSAAGVLIGSFGALAVCIFCVIRRFL